MRLIREQGKRLLRERGIWITEACDRCGKLLGSIRWTRKGELGEWCSAECRDGIAMPETVSSVQAKRCLECGVPLHGKRSDSKFCSDVHSKRYRRRGTSSTSQKCGNNPDTLVAKQGLTKAQNDGTTDTLTTSSQAPETTFSDSSVSETLRELRVDTDPTLEPDQPHYFCQRGDHEICPGFRLVKKNRARCSCPCHTETGPYENGSSAIIASTGPEFHNVRQDLRMRNENKRWSQ